MPKRSRYPCVLDCYLLVARDGKPPHPEDKPVETFVVSSKEEVNTAKQDLKSKYPNSWCVERPLDWL